MDDSSSMVDLTSFVKATTPFGVSSSDHENNYDRIGSEASHDDDDDSGKSKRRLEGTEMMNIIGSSGKIQKTDDEIWKTTSTTSSTEGIILCNSTSTSSDDDIYVKNQVVVSSPKPKTYACNVCAKTFSSHLALGGHKSSHTKFKMIICDAVDLRPRGHNQLSMITNLNIDRRTTYTCKICFQEFPSGQALGGHQRRHYKPPKILDFDLNQLPNEDDQDHDDQHPSAKS